jgi:phenylacetate-CoA ligase
MLNLSGSDIHRNIKEIIKISKYSENDIKKYQREKIVDILQYAYKNVPYYKKVFDDSDIIKNGKVELDNFKKLPFLTKDIMRQEGTNLYSKEKRKGVYENTSGGSTGEPVRFLQDKYYSDWNIANKIYVKLKAGQQPGMKELRFWGSERDLLEGREKLSIRLRNWLYNRKEFNTFKMSEKDMLEYVKKWNKYKPCWVESYVQSIFEFAKFIENNNLKIHSPKNGILTSAGTLFPEMREKIEEVFKCKVYNRYGSREVGDMACGTGELKLSLWNHYIEVIDNKIYVTALNNYSMPFIRYDIGDIGKLSSDGLAFSNVEGREMSAIRTNLNKIIPAEFFIHFIGVVHNDSGISKFQVIQKKIDYLEINVVIKNLDRFDKEKKNIEKSIKLEFGDSDCFIKWNIVNQIDPLKNGKYEYVRSEV